MYVVRETEIFKISTYHNVNIIYFSPLFEIRNYLHNYYHFASRFVYICRAGEKIPISEIINVGLNLASFWPYFILVFGC